MSFIEALEKTLAIAIEAISEIESDDEKQEAIDAANRVADFLDVLRKE